MKNTLSFTAALFFAASVFAQEIPATQVPSVVKNSFSKSYPSAKGVEWEKKGNLYNAEFDLSRIDHEVWIDAKGIIVRHKKDLNRAQLPAAVSAAIKKQYPQHRLDDVDQYTEGKQVFYKVELEKAGVDTHVVFDQSGKVSPKIFN